MSAPPEVSGARRARLPVFVLLLAISPALAVATTGTKALALAAVIIPVLVLSRALQALLGPSVSGGARLALHILLVGILVTVADVLYQTWAPALRAELGIYLQLTGASSLLLGSIVPGRPPTSFAHSILDAAGVGLGSGLGLVAVACLREALGTGTISIRIGGLGGVLQFPWLAAHPARVATQAAGALLIVGLLMGLARWIRMKRDAP